jgi:hypothetical protein
MLIHPWIDGQSIRSERMTDDGRPLLVACDALTPRPALEVGASSLNRRVGPGGELVVGRSVRQVKRALRMQALS